jgi:hypothetical protein
MNELEEKGCLVFEEYLSPKITRGLLGEVQSYKKKNTLQEIHRPMKPRPLRYKVIDGEIIKNSFTRIWDLYQNKVLQLAREQSGLDLNVLDSEKVGVNINIMAPQLSTYRWHYDRNAVTAILYLNTVEGGETVLFPNYRILLKNKRLSTLQQSLDRGIHFPPLRSLFVKKSVVPPKSGKLVMMAGNKCWHSVRALQGNEERINIIFAYDVKSEESGMNENLDAYLYSQDKSASEDPNYKN